MNKRSEQTGNHGHADDYTLYETQHTSKGDAKMKALDKVLQDTNAGTLNDTTLFYTNGDTLTGTQSEVKAALTESARSEVQAVLTHGDDALLATLDGWYASQVEQEVLGQIGTWEEFKTLLPNEYELDLQDIHAYLHSQEVVSNLDQFYERLIDEDEDEEEVIKPQTEALHEVLQDTEPGTMYDTTIFFTDGTYETGTIYTLAGAVDGRDRKEIRAAISHSTEQLLGALDGWDSDIFEHINSWEEFQAYSPEEYEQVLEDLWTSAKADEEQIINRVYSILEMQKGGC